MPGNARAGRRNVFTFGIGAALVFSSVSVFGQSASPPQSAVIGSRTFHLEAAPGAYAIGGPLGQGGVQSTDEVGTHVVGAPYSAVGIKEEVTRLLDGNRIVTRQETRFYRDGQGRTRVEEGQPPALARFNGVGAFSIPRIHDPVAGEHYMLHSHDKTVHVLATMPEGAERPPSITPPVALPPPLMQMLRSSVRIGTTFMMAPLATPDEQKPLGEKIIRGVKAVGTRLKHTVAAGSVGNDRPIIITTDYWFSPQLGVAIESVSRSPTGHEATYRLEQIVLGEPDATLFQVPADYTREEISRGFRTIRAIKLPDGNTGQTVEEGKSSIRVTPLEKVR
jgi:hypothetical protein